MAWIEPKLNWKDTDKYNAADFNRVENNTVEVANRLNDLMYLISLGATNTGRDTSYIDFISSINRIENNIDIIKNGFLSPPGWQDKKTWSVGMGFDYKDANRLENNLFLLYSWSQIAKDNLIYSGTFNCGADWEGGLC